jgi:membrane protease YdiL (CAAX protease family)
MFREPPFRNFPPSLKILALILVMIITFLVVLALGVAFSLPFFGKDFLDSMAQTADYSDPRTIAGLKYFQIVNQLGVFIIPAILFVILTDNHFSRYLSFDSGIKTVSIIMGILVLIVSLPFINWLVLLNSQLHLPDFLSGVERWMRDSEDKAQALTDAFLLSGTWGGFLVNLTMVALLAAVGEELIFRGILVRLFREWTWNVHLAVMIPALLFSALHLQFYGFFGRFVLGVVLGYLFVLSGSLWVPVIVHFFNNAMAVLVSFLSQRGVIKADLETLGSSDNGLIIAVSFILMIAGLGILYYHETGRCKKKTPVEEQPGS